MMNIEEYVKSLDDDIFLGMEQENNYELFLTCLRLGRLKIALKFSKFITKEFLEEYGDNIIELVKNDFPYYLKTNRVFRDFLLERKQYDLLINMQYSLLMEIQNQQVLSELDKIADAEITFKNIYRDYTKYRAMKLKKFELFHNNSFPYEREFVDMFYDDIINILDDINKKNQYIYIKALEMGDFDIAEKVGPFYIPQETIDEVVDKYWNKVLIFNEKGVSDIFRGSDKLFNYYLQEKHFDRLLEFYPYLLTEKIINQYESEIMLVLSNGINDNSKYNDNLFKLCLKNERFDLCAQFYIEWDNDLIQTYAKKILPFMKDISSYLKDNIDFFNLVLETERFDLVEYFDNKLITDEILQKYGKQIITNLTSIPYSLRKNSLMLKIALASKKYELANEFYEESFNDEILALPEFWEYLKVEKTLPYFCPRTTNVLKMIISIGRLDLLYAFPPEEFTDEIIENLIDTTPIGSDKIPMSIFNENGIRIIIQKGRYDLLTLIIQKERYNFLTGKYYIGSIISEKMYKEFAEELLTKMPFINEFKNSNSLLKYALEHKMVELIPNFSISAYDDALIEKYGDSLYSLLLNKFLEKRSYFSKKGRIKSKALLVLFLKNGMTDRLDNFDSDCFDEDIIDKYFELLLSKGLNATLNLQENSYFLDKIIQINREDLLTIFNISAFTKEIINKHFDFILNYIKNNNTIPLNIQNINLFEKFIKEGMIDYAISMDQLSLPEDYIEDNYDYLLNLAIKNNEKSFSKRLFNTLSFAKKFIKDCPLEDVKYIGINLFFSELNEYYPKFIEWVIKYNNNMIPVELVSSSKLKSYCKDNGYDELYLNFIICNQDDFKLKMKINIDMIVNEYAPLLGMSKYQLMNKIGQLYLINNELFTTLLPKLLSNRFSVLSIKHFLTISLYPDLQEEIISLNDEELLLLERILNITDACKYDSTSILYNVLKNMKFYNKIINSNKIINEEQLYNLIYILQRKNNVFDINSIDDLSNTSLFEKMLSKFNNFDMNTVTDNDIQTVRDMLLLKEYGIDLFEAEFICDRYCKDKEIVINSKLDNYLKNLLIDLYDILYIFNLDELKFKYNSCNIVMPDFKSLLYLESYIRGEYAKLYDKTLYKVKEEDRLENKEYLISNPSALEKIKGINYNGKRPNIYMLSEDFNLEIHALGAYSGYSRPDNFLDDWNQPRMASHGICTSYIGNNQIANARAYHPILGFDSISDKELLLVANYDIGSTYANLSYSTSRMISANCLPPEENINYTRHTHNEVVIERMRYDGMTVCKKMPSYIVYLLDDINNKYNFMTKTELIDEFKDSGKEDLIEEINQNKDSYFITNLLKINKISPTDAKKISCVYFYEEVVQASIDMNLPIVMVDRLYYAKREKRKCDLMYEQLLQTGDAYYISCLLLTYFNNMIGCIDYFKNNSEYCKCFDSDGFAELFNKLMDNINNLQDNEAKLQHLNVLSLELEKEISKRTTFEDLGQLHIYVEEVNEKIKNIKLSMVEGYNGKNL